VQLVGFGMLVGGLAIHHWHVPPAKPMVVPLVAPGIAGVSGRF
jgi:hypothetical protein